MQNMNCYSNTLAAEQEKMQLRIQEDATKMDIRNQKKLYLEQQKMLLKEAERERKKAQCEVVCVDQNGAGFCGNKEPANRSIQKASNQFYTPKNYNFVSDYESRRKYLSVRIRPKRGDSLCYVMS